MSICKTVSINGFAKSSFLCSKQTKAYYLSPRWNRNDFCSFCINRERNKLKCCILNVKFMPAVQCRLKNVFRVWQISIWSIYLYMGYNYKVYKAANLRTTVIYKLLILPTLFWIDKHKQAGSELGQAQLKLGLGFTSVKLH